MRRLQNVPLWLGHVGDARDLRSVLSAGILALVDLALNEPPVVVTRELAYCRFPLLDGPGNSPWMIHAAINCLAGLLRSEVPTLVFCSAGLSRTPVIAAAALVGIRGGSLAQRLAEVTSSGPADVSPGLLAEVQNALDPG